jgi:hypothetical protein
VCTTTGSPATDLADFLGGFVAAEGCFSRTRNTTRFRFAVALAAADAAMCGCLRLFLGCGSVHQYRRRREHYDDEVVFAVQGLRDLIEIVVPFMDAHLPPSFKREQYLTWRGELLEAWGRRRR